MQRSPVHHPVTPDRVLREHGPRVFRFALQLLGNEAEAEDLTEEVLLRAMRQLHTFRGSSSLAASLDVEAVNAAVAFRRERAGRQWSQFGEESGSRLGGAHRGVRLRGPRRPAEQAQARELPRLIGRVIADLPAPEAQVLMLADLEGLDRAEIGARLGLRLGAVESRLRLARLMARASLATHFERPARPGQGKR